MENTSQSTPVNYGKSCNPEITWYPGYKLLYGGGFDTFGGSWTEENDLLVIVEVSKDLLTT